jgi:outer membrane protein assembly factor BamB
MRSSINRVFKAALFCALLSIINQTSFAQDWPGWRGPARDGVLTSFTAPKTWPAQLKRIWKVEIGAGHSSPIVAGRRVYTHSRQGDKEVVSSFELETGKAVWQDTYPAAYTMNPAAMGHGKGPKSTPVIANGRLYTLGISGILSCYDAAAGRLKWRKEFSKEYKATSPLYGTAMSPIVEGGLLIAHIGGQDSGALVAFDAETGNERWAWKGDGPGYASPIVIDIEGVRQIVTQSQNNVIGARVSDGQLLWQIPFTTEYVQNIITPVVYKQTIIYSGLDKGATAIRVTSRAGKWTAEQVWHNPQVAMYMSSPVVIGDYVFGLSHKRKGQFFCLDARTGEARWMTEGREGDNAAILAGAGLLFLLDDSAELTIAKGDGRAFEPLKKYSVADSATWAHPVVIGNRILIKDAESLAMWSLE